MLGNQIQFLKKDILKTNIKHKSYEQEVGILSGSKDLQIDKTRMDVAETNSIRLTLKQRRDKCFMALVDLQSERRVMLGEVNKNELMQQQRDMLALKRIRMEPHKKQEDEMMQWDEQTQLIENIKDRDLQQDEQFLLMDPVQKSEKQNELEQMMQEIEFKQK